MWKYAKTSHLSKIQDVFSSVFYNNMLIYGLSVYPVSHMWSRLQNWGLFCTGDSKSWCKYEHKPQEASRIFILLSDKKSLGSSLIEQFLVPTLTHSRSDRFLNRWSESSGQLRKLQMSDCFCTCTWKRTCTWKAFFYQLVFSDYWPRLLNPLTFLSAVWIHPLHDYLHSTPCQGHAAHTYLH